MVQWMDATWQAKGRNTGVRDDAGVHDHLYQVFVIFSCFDPRPELYLIRTCISSTQFHYRPTGHFVCPVFLSCHN